MKQYTIYGFDGYPIAGTEPFISGSVAQITGGTWPNIETTGQSIVAGTWIPTHFAFGEVAEIIGWHCMGVGMGPGASGTITLSFDGTWDPTLVTTGDNRLDKLCIAYACGVNGNSVNINTAAGTRGYIGHAGRGTTSSTGSILPAPLPPYIRPVINFVAYQTGTMILTLGLYGPK